MFGISCDFQIYQNIKGQLFWKTKSLKKDNLKYFELNELTLSIFSNVSLNKSLKDHLKIANQMVMSTVSLLEQWLLKFT